MLFRIFTILLTLMVFHLSASAASSDRGQVPHHSSDTSEILESLEHRKIFGSVESREFNQGDTRLFLGIIRCSHSGSNFGKIFIYRYSENSWWLVKDVEVVGGCFMYDFSFDPSLGKLLFDVKEMSGVQGGKRSVDVPSSEKIGTLVSERLDGQGASNLDVPDLSPPD